jgi:hypothetical protein
VSSNTLRARIGAGASVLAMNLRLRFGEFALVLLLAILGILFFFGWLAFSTSHPGPNWGLGPEWACDGRPSALVCIKHPIKNGN